MPILVPKQCISLLLLSLLISVRIHAQDASATTPPNGDDQQAMRKISGIFDTDLPKTEQKGSVRFIVLPHFGDFSRRSYVRLPLGVRWGVNNHVEITATIEPYLQHGLRSGSPGNGIGDVQFGGKYAYRHWLQTDYDASIGLNVRLPVGAPPLDMTDGYNHYTPFLVVSRPSERTPGLNYFFSGTADLMAKSSVAGSFRQNDAHSSSLILGTGFVLDRFPYHYTLETGLQTTSFIGRDHQQYVFVKPGFAWDLPRRLTFNSHGRWLFGLSVKITQGPDGTRIDSGGKIRGDFSLSRWWRGKKASNAAAEK
ncbi:MAG: hypothetical protein WCI28_03240 [Opitutaceae bacterium]